MSEPVTVEQHLERVLGAVEPLPAVDVPLADALDLVSTEDAVAPTSLPRFDNSAMDGYAVRVVDVAGASADAPVALPVVGGIGAGQGGPEGAAELAPGTATKIMTGAPVPPGADAVVPYEWTDAGTETVVVRDAPSPRQHVRDAGGDVVAGQTVLAAGTRLGPRHLGLLASVGHASVRVRPRPRVLVVSTGSELREPGTPLDQLAPDAIYDGNSHLLAAAAVRAGAVPERLGIVTDSPEAFLAALAERAGSFDVVVTSGGVSMGDFDVVKAALRPGGTGGEEGIWFGPVAMQPGKPQGFGRLADVAGRGPLIFTLPGNPVSSYLSFELFVRPALRTMMGRTPVSRPEVEARLADGVSSPPGRRQFLRGRYDESTGEATVVPVGGSGSHLVAHLAGSDAVIVVPEDTTSIAAGEVVSVVLLDVDD